MDEKDEKFLTSQTKFNDMHLHQKESIRFLIRNGGRGMNASEMGTGKTATAIVVADYFSREDGLQLFVVPASVNTTANSPKRCCGTGL